MSVRERIQDMSLLLSMGRPSGAMLSLLAAVSATSRRRYPVGTASRVTPDKKMGDREAFEAFLADEMASICHVHNFHISFRGDVHRLEHVLYKWLRYTLLFFQTISR